VTKLIPDKAIRKQAELLPQILRTVFTAVAEKHPADAALARVYRQHPEFGSRDRNFFSAIVFAYFRWKGWVEPAAGTDLAAAVVLAHLLDAEQIHPTIQRIAGPDLASGRLLRRDTRSGPAGGPSDVPTPWGSLDLAAKAAAFAALVGGAAPSVAQLVPDWLPEALCVPPGTDPAAHRARVIAAFQQTPPTWIRARRGHLQEVCSALGRAGIAYTAHPRVPEALTLPRGSALAALPAPARAGFEIQDLASQLTGLVCAPEPDAAWWDACAGSGGKALHLADLMHGFGRILATDIRASAVAELGRRARQAGAVRVEPALWEEQRDPAPGLLFDGVLIDAPCSGVGTWHRNPDARWRTSHADVQAKAAIQTALLARCADKVRPGGVLVYATCTLTRAENEDVVAGFLRARPDYTLDPFRLPLTDSDVAGRLWLWPWEGPCNGMFIARMKRRP
jgi:16S rRNA (cytosine967-C5)-methyltransferase